MKRITRTVLPGLLALSSLAAIAQDAPNDGLNNNLANIYRTSDAKTFSISPENLTGEKGKGAGKGRPPVPEDEPVLIGAAYLMEFEGWSQTRYLAAIRHVTGDYETGAEKEPMRRLVRRLKREREKWLEEARWVERETQARYAPAPLDPSFSGDGGHAPRAHLPLRMKVDFWRNFRQ